jgi:hypothetical protein
MRTMSPISLLLRFCANNFVSKIGPPLPEQYLQRLSTATIVLIGPPPFSSQAATRFAIQQNCGAGKYYLHRREYLTTQGRSRTKAWDGDRSSEKDSGCGRVPPKFRHPSSTSLCL